MGMVILPNLIYQNHILLLCTSVNSEIQPHQKDKRSATCLPVPRFSLAQISGTIWIHHTFLPLALVYEVSTWHQDAFFIPGTLYQHTTIGDACSFLPVSKICTQTRHVFLSLSLCCAQNGSSIECAKIVRRVRACIMMLSRMHIWIFYLLLHGKAIFSTDLNIFWVVYSKSWSKLWHGSAILLSQTLKYLVDVWCRYWISIKSLYLLSSSTLLPSKQDCEAHMSPPKESSNNPVTKPWFCWADRKMSQNSNI